MSKASDNRHRQAALSGFTLMELIVVILILGLLASIAAPQAVKYLSRAKSDTARLQVDALAANLDFYKIDVGDYPSEEQGLEALTERPANAENWMGPYVQKSSSLIDPWGEPYIYSYESGGDGFGLQSLGADRKPGGEGENADIVFGD